MKRRRVLLVVASILCLCCGLVACNSSDGEVDVALDRSELTLAVGEEQTLVATVNADKGVSDKTVVWESKNESVAAVDQNGKVTAKAVGTALIAVSSNHSGKTAVCTVTVTDVHEHVYGKTFDCDASGHWPKVLCGCADAEIKKEAHRFDGFGVCEVCRYVDPSKEAEGLVFALNADGQSYSVVAAGTSTAKTYVNIPATHDGMPVTAIKANAFDQKSGLEHISIPEGVTRVGEYAFYGCFNARILLPSTLRLIGANAFKGCANMDVTELPEGIEEIPESAFDGCDGITSLVLPESVKIVGAYAFNNCANLRSVMLPEGLLKIYASAFFNCPLLSDITIPKNVNEIGRYAFYNCGLKAVALGDGITKIEEGVFSDCEDLESVTFGDEITSIGKQAFSGCGKIRRIALPDSLVSVGEEAFRDCALLSGIGIGASLSMIGDGAFSGCASIAAIEVSEDNPTYVGAGGCLIDKATKEIKNGFAQSVIPTDGTATGIGANAFANLNALISVTIPSVIENVGNNAFKGCSRLRSVTIESGETTFGTNVFESCIALDRVSFPEGMSITQAMFKNCSGLSTLSLEGVRSIGNSAFYGCGSLKSVIIPSSVTSVETGAFSNCTQLARAEVLANIAALPSLMFESCAKLETVVLSESVKTIPYNAFAVGGGLREVYYLGDHNAWQGVELQDAYFDANIIKTEAVTVYCFSASAPTPEQKADYSTWWHYGADNATIVIWE